MNKVDLITKKQIRTDLETFQVGDTVAVDVRITEGKRQRIQTFEGLVIALQGRGIGKTFTVRKTSSGVGVERIIPVNSPIIAKLTVVRKGSVRQAKLGYVRKSIKQVKIKERN